MTQTNTHKQINTAAERLIICLQTTQKHVTSGLSKVEKHAVELFGKPRN